MHCNDFPLFHSSNQHIIFFFVSAVILPSPSTPVKTPSKTEQQTTTILSTLPSFSIKTSTLSSTKSSSIHHTTTQSGQQPTTPSTCAPPTSTRTTACLPDSCKNGGTCVLPGNYCKCEKGFAWHDCSVHVGKWKFITESSHFSFVEH